MPPIDKIETNNSSNIDNIQDLPLMNRTKEMISRINVLKHNFEKKVTSFVNDRQERMKKENQLLWHRSFILDNFDKTAAVKAEKIAELQKEISEIEAKKPEKLKNIEELEGKKNKLQKLKKTSDDNLSYWGEYWKINNQIVENKNYIEQLKELNINLEIEKKAKDEIIEKRQQELAAAKSQYKKLVADNQENMEEWVQKFKDLIFNTNSWFDDVEVISDELNKVTKINIGNIKTEINNLISNYFLKPHDETIGNNSQYRIDIDRLISYINDNNLGIEGLGASFISFLEQLKNCNINQTMKVPVNSSKNKKLIKKENKEKVKKWNENLVNNPIITVNFLYKHILQNFKTLPLFLLYVGHLAKTENQAFFATMVPEEQWDITQKAEVASLLETNDSDKIAETIIFTKDRKYGLWKTNINQKEQMVLIDFTILLKLPMGFKSYLNEYRQVANVKVKIFDKIYNEFKSNLAEVEIKDLQNKVNLENEVKPFFKDLDLLFENDVDLQKSYESLITTCNTFFADLLKKIKELKPEEASCVAILEEHVIKELETIKAKFLHLATTNEIEETRVKTPYPTTSPLVSDSINEIVKESNDYKNSEETNNGAVTTVNASPF